MNYTQNERIAQVGDNTLVVGIDIGSDKHYARAFTERGMEISRKAFMFENTEALNTFSRLEPWKALLFANSPWGDFLCARDHFWKKSMHGVNPRNVDGYDAPLRDIDGLTDYIRSMSLYCVEREEKYIHFVPTSLEEYFRSPSVRGEYYDGQAWKEIVFSPELGDLAWLRSFKFEDLT